MVKGKGRSKDGYSLYMLFETFCSSSQGRKKLKNIFLRPTYDLDILEKRLNTQQFFFKHLTIEDETMMRKMLRRVYDLNLILKRFYNVTEDYDE